MNDLARGKVLTGQYLLVPPSSGHQYINQASNRILTAAAASPRQVYAVKSGDTLWSISSKSGVSPQQILAWNGIDKDTPLRPGQQLLLKNAKAANVPVSSARSSNVASSSQGNQKIRYVVKAGDSLYGLARRLKVDVDELCRWNQLKASENLRAGQILILYLSKLP
jgi:membrane-bound lytic murein transglycosylase D